MVHPMGPRKECGVNAVGIVQSEKIDRVSESKPLIFVNRNMLIPCWYPAPCTCARIKSICIASEETRSMIHFTTIGPSMLDANDSSCFKSVNREILRCLLQITIIRLCMAWNLSKACKIALKSESNSDIINRLITFVIQNHDRTVRNLP